jgi:hypothetical protein
LNVTDSIGLLGIHLQLLIGRSKPVPAPYEVVDALLGVKVVNNDRDRDGFQLDFSVGRNTSLEYSLVTGGLLDVPNHVSIVVFFGARAQVLIDGQITNLQSVPSNEPGRSTLHVIGEDLSVAMSLEDQNKSHPNQKDSTIVSEILSRAGFTPDVAKTDDTPNDRERVPTQQCSNLRYVRNLAQRNGYVFYVEPTDVPGKPMAYWGPEQRSRPPQPPLTMNMGPETNVDRPINFQYNGLGPVETQVTIIDSSTGQPQSIQAPTTQQPAFAANPARPLRKSIARNAANKTAAQALLIAGAGSRESSSALEARGEVDAARYGCALRARRPVTVRGAGQSYDGLYYVKQVEHNIRRYPQREYKMSFILIREGRGATRSTVPQTGGG